MPVATLMAIFQYITFETWITTYRLSHQKTSPRSTQISSGRSSGSNARTSTRFLFRYQATAASSNGPWRKVLNFKILNSSSEKQTPIKETSMRALSVSKKPVEWHSLTLEVFQLIFRSTIQATIILWPRRTVRCTSAQHRFRRGTHMIIMVIWDLFTGCAAIHSGMQMTARFSWLARTIGRCVSGMRKIAILSSSATRSKVSLSKSTIYAGLQTPPQFSPRSQMTAVSRSGTSNVTL